MMDKKRKTDAPDLTVPVLDAAASRDLMQGVLAEAKRQGAEHAQVGVSGGAGGNVRFARNGITTTGAVRSLRMSVQVAVGKRWASVSTNRLDPESIRSSVGDAMRFVRMVPDDKEWMPPVEPQTYAKVDAWVEQTAGAKPSLRAEAVGTVTRDAKAKKTVTAGFYQTGGHFSALANSSGLFAWHRDTGARLTATTRTPDGTGSGWATSYARDVQKVDVGAVAGGSIGRAVRSREPQALEPGAYPVILEPEAVDNLLGSLGWSMSARAADEGRSFFSKEGGGNKRGEKIFDTRISVKSDPTHALTRSRPFAGDGRAVQPIHWIKDGVLENLEYSRYWAKKQGVKPTTSGGALLIEGKGKTTSLDEMIAGAERAILVTRFWYIRDVDPKQLLLTGLTRDGLFLVEKGKIVRPLKNFRFNESPVEMLNHLEAFSEPVTVGGGRAVPALFLKHFRFTSVSQAV